MIEKCLAWLRDHKPFEPPSDDPATFQTWSEVQQRSVVVTTLSSDANRAANSAVLFHQHPPPAV